MLKQTAGGYFLSTSLDNNSRIRYELARTELSFRLLTQRPRSAATEKIPQREDGMDFEKDNFEDDNEMSPLEDEELGGDADEIVEAEEEDLVVADEGDEEAPAAKPAPKPAAKKPAKKAAKKAKPKKAAKKKAAKKPAKKAKKPAKKKKRR
jgi:hypothetical protein